jgi:hypothetical protein
LIEAEDGGLVNVDRCGCRCEGVHGVAYRCNGWCRHTVRWSG